MLNAQETTLASGELLPAEAAEFLWYFEQGMEVPTGATVIYPVAVAIPLSDGKKEEVVPCYVGYEPVTVRGKTEYHTACEYITGSQNLVSEALERAHKQFEKYRKLVKLVLDGVINCYISPIRGRRSALDPAYHHVLNDQAIYIFSSSYVQVVGEDRHSSLCLVTFKREELEQVLKQKQPRKWGNQSSSSLTGEHVRAISRALDVILSKSNGSEEYKELRIPANDLARIVSVIAGLTLKKNDDVSNNIALATIKNHLAEKHSRDLSKLLMKKGKPSNQNRLLLKKFESEINYH